MKDLLSLSLKDTTVVSDEEIVGGERPEEDYFHGAPRFRRVVLHTRPGAGSFIVSEIWLPPVWNGEFVGVGNGGMAGGIPGGRMMEFLRAGYAVASTDMGTSRGTASGVQNPDVWRDFGWRATARMTELSKDVCVAVYGKLPDYSYFVGESTGGQQAMAMAERFPAYYDGIIAGVPAFNRIFLHTYFLWCHNHLRLRDGRRLFSNEEIASIRDAAVTFAALRGDADAGDDFIARPDVRESAVAELVAFLQKSFPSMTEEQVNALRAVYGGPRNPRTGARIYNGMPVGSEIYGCGMSTLSEEGVPHYYPFQWAFGMDFDPYDFDFDRHMEEIADLLGPDMNANSTDLASFRDHGGKLLMYSGSADPCVPYPDALGYFLRVCERFGASETDAFMRYFLLPGKDHSCGGHGIRHFVRAEDGRDSAFAALTDWVKYRKAPACLKGRIEHEGGEEIREVLPYDPAKAPADFDAAVCCVSYLEK